MVAIPRYVSTPPEAAARIAGFIFGDGNPEHIDPQFGVMALTALDTTTWTQSECVRCANILGWVLGTDYRLPSNGNFICRQTSIYTALGRPTTPTSFYYRALEPTGTWTPTRAQVEAFTASVIETEGQAGTAPDCKVYDEARGGLYDQRIDAMVITLNLQSLGATRQGISTRVPVDLLDAFPLPLISAARYPGILPANWPDSAPPNPDITPPPVPTGLVAVVGDSQLSLTWGTVSAPDLVGYRLFRGATQIYQGAVSSFIDTGLTNGVAYTYTVASYDTSNNQSAASVSTTETPVAGPVVDAPPAPATNLAGSATSSTITLTWVASVSSDVVSYQAFRGATQVGSVTGASFLDTGLSAETIYTYRVVAVDAGGNISTSTDFISVTTLAAAVTPPVVTSPTIISRLGCGVYDLYILDRAGTTQLRPIPFSTLRWSRVVDDTSSAVVNLGSVNGNSACCEAVAGIRQYAFEPGIYRDSRLVWQGPIVDAISRGEDFELRADDKSGWLKVRVIHNALNYPEPGVDAATIFNAIVADAMLPDNVPGLTATALATGIAAARDYTTNPPTIAYDAIQELARTGVDYTMVGPSMVAGSFIVPTPSIAFLTDQALGELPSPELLGANYGSQWYVTGDPDNNLMGQYGGIDTTAGLVERIAQEDDIDDIGSLNQNARSRWELTSASYISSVRLVLNEQAPLPIDLAIPGAVVDLRLTEGCIPVVGSFRIREVEVDVGDTETVAIVCEPVGTEIVE